MQVRCLLKVKLIAIDLTGIVGNLAQRTDANVKAAFAPDSLDALSNPGQQDVVHIKCIFRQD